jgi:hypothetical protein
VTATRDRTRVTHRIRGLPAGDEVHMSLQRDVLTQLRQLQPWDGSPLLPALRARLERAWQKVLFRTEPSEELEAESIGSCSARVRSRW